MAINMSEDMYTRIHLIRIISEKKKFVFVVYLYIYQEVSSITPSKYFGLFYKQKFQLFLEHIGRTYSMACDIGI